MPELIPTKRFGKALAALGDDEAALVMKAIKAFMADPWGGGLNFEKIKGTNYCSIRASRGFRIVLRKSGSGAYDLIDVGPHDYVYGSYGRK